MEDLSNFGSYSESTVRSSRCILDENGKWRLYFNPWVSVLYGFESNLEDFTPDFDKLKNPILVLIANENSSAMTPRGIENMKTNLSSAKFVHFPEAEHNIHKSQEQEYLKAVLGFLLQTPN